MALLVFCGGADVTSDDAAWSSTFALIYCFVDHYFFPGEGERISVEVLVPGVAGVG